RNPIRDSPDPATAATLSDDIRAATTGPPLGWYPPLGHPAARAVPPLEQPRHTGTTTRAPPPHEHHRHSGGDIRTRTCPPSRWPCSGTDTRPSHRHARHSSGAIRLRPLPVGMRPALDRRHRAQRVAPLSRSSASLPSRVAPRPPRRTPIGTTSHAPPVD